MSLQDVIEHIDFGKYGAAVERHAAVLGRPAPHPTEPAPRGGRRLSAKFVEWMMMLPEGHVTDVPGLSRNTQLRLLGNGVVPLQAEVALKKVMQAVQLVPATAATGSSSSPNLPTPTATPYGSNQSASPGAAVRPSLKQIFR